jgi:hypothetical protein
MLWDAHHFGFITKLGKTNCYRDYEHLKKPKHGVLIFKILKKTLML